MPDSVKQVDGSGGVGGEGGEGVLVAGDDEGLGGQVENDLRLVGGEKGLERGRVPHIPAHIHNPLPGPGEGEHIGVGGWLQAEPHHIGSHRFQPMGEPGAFETGVPGDEDGFVLVDLSEGVVHRNS